MATQNQRAKTSYHPRTSGQEGTLLVLQERADQRDLRLIFDRGAVRPYQLRIFETRGGWRKPSGEGLAVSRRELAAILIAALVEDSALQSLVFDLASRGGAE